jgi:hypothetical protein
VTAVPVFLSLEGQCAAQGHPPALPRAKPPWGPAILLEVRPYCHCGRVQYGTVHGPEDAA